MATEPPIRWYASVGAKYLDLVGDYAGKEKFFVEGDSLLLECFSDSQLDFNPGFQLLHAAYLVERYLHNLQRRGCVFDIVFFEDNSSLCVPPTSKSDSKYLLARAAILKHLQNQSSYVNVLVFQNPDGIHFARYLQDSACYFALCSDGASYKYSKEKSLRLAGHAVQTANENLQEDNKLKLRTTIWKLMTEKRLDVALLNGLAWQDSKVFAFVLERNIKSRAAMKLLQEPQTDSLSETLPDLNIGGNVLPEAQEAVSHATTLLTDHGLPASSRLIATVATLKLMSLEEYADLVLPQLAHVLLLDGLSLEARTPAIIDFPPKYEELLDEYEEAFFKCAYTHIFTAMSDVDSTIVDLFDGRLLRFVLYNLGAALEILPQAFLSPVRSLAKSIMDVSEEANPTGKLVLSSGSKSANEIGSSILPFSHPAFDRHLSTIHVHVDPKGQAATGKLAWELTHWHNSKMLVQPKGQKPRLDAKQEARAQRAHQKFIAQLTRYAESLTDSFGKGLEPKLIHIDDASNIKSAAKASKSNSGHSGQTNKPKKLKGFQQKPGMKGKQSGNSTPDQNGDINKHKPLTPEALIECLQDQGPLLERSMDAQEDSRVPFKPDGWQVKVLDEIDQGNSMLVVAPTSAGKTFISFYAMEKALRTSDDAVLVYVAPTKALVNQIAAEVLGKFKKAYKYAGPTIYSIFTRDYRIHNPLKAQILVTVPHLLQIMLMSPTNKDWVPRIKTIIFDEVHSVSQAEDGLIWEQLLMTAPCQIIALSATIGNTDEFSSWLSSTSSATGRKFSLIQHEHRHSDLRKYLYTTDTHKVDLEKGLPKTASASTQAFGIESTKSMQLIHPVASLLHPQRGIPSDLALESSDCLVLWRTMTKFQTPEYEVPAELRPSSYFGNMNPAKVDIIRWATELKDFLAAWMKERDTSPFFKVVKEFRQELIEIDTISDIAKTQVDFSNGDKTSNDLLSSTMPMLCDLRAQDALPAILFNYNRAVCEDIGEYLLDQLVEAESAFKEKDPAWKAKMEKYEQWLKDAPAREKASKSTDQKKGKTSKGAEGREANESEKDGMGSKADRSQAGDSMKDPFYETFDPEAPLDQFSFANIKKGDKPLLDEYVKHFSWVGVSKRLIDAFRRGICVHHAGMNRSYRQAAEMFFRRGFLTVVIATGTLSLGINMPCKTVVFSGDSAFLTALNYRQASGRAGRRGFDLLGNVVFQGLPTEKALRLISSKLPDINGHFPLTTAFVLRLLSLLHGTKNADYAMSMVDAVLSRPRLFAGGEEFKHQVLHHVRFSIEYLRSQGLLNAEGHPIGFSNCVSHLYFVENSALAFHALLKEGYFHELVKEFPKGEERTLKKLMLILSNIFGRRPMRPVESDEEKDFIKRSVSLVVLPEMPTEAGAILKEHNMQTLQTYRTYVSTYVEQHCKEPDITLPFTQTTISPSGIADGKPVKLPHSSPAPKMRSPFVALSGLDDSFSSISDLCDTVRGGVFLEKAVIPYLDMGDELTTPLNAYLYDFYNSGSVKALLEANRIPRGDLWFLLKDFSLVLATMITAMENFLNPKLDGEIDLANDGESDHDVDDATTLAEVEGSTRVNTPDPSEMSSAASASMSPVKKATQPSTKVKKKKVLDSWDDESSSEEEVEVVDDEVAQAANKLAGEKAERELRGVVRMFKKLQEEFEGKFKKMWA